MEHQEFSVCSQSHIQLKGIVDPCRTILPGTYLGRDATDSSLNKAMSSLSTSETSRKRRLSTGSYFQDTHSSQYEGHRPKQNLVFFNEDHYVLHAQQYASIKGRRFGAPNIFQLKPSAILPATVGSCVNTDVSEDQSSMAN